MVPSGRPSRSATMFSAAGHPDRAGLHAGDARARADLDALAPELAPRALGERGMHAAQDLLARLEEQQPVVAGIDAAVPRDDVAVEEVLQLGDQLDARVAAADDADGEHPPPRGRIGLVVGVLRRIEDVIAQHDAVLEPLVAEGVLLHTRHAEARHHAAHGHDQPVVTLDPLGHDHAAAGEVDVRHRVATEAEAARAADVAQRLNDVSRLDHRGGDLGQERREEQVVPVADQEDLDVGAIAQPALEHAHSLHPGEAAAEDDDPHHTSSTTRQPSGNTRGTLPVSPPPVTFAIAETGTAASSARTADT